jgi:hypothetical protein
MAAVINESMNSSLKPARSSDGAARAVVAAAVTPTAPPGKRDRSFRALSATSSIGGAEMRKAFLVLAAALLCA